MAAIPLVLPLTISLVTPLLRSPFGCMIAAGIIVFALSAYCKSPKLASRFQLVAFIVFTGGALTVVKGIAEAYQR